MNNLNDFHYSMTLANMLYNIDMLQENFEEIGLIAWNLIGNKITRVYRTCLTVNQTDNSIQLPCNCDEIEAVTYGFEDWEKTSNIYSDGDTNSSYAESYIEANKTLTDPLYQRGRYVKYNQVGDILYLKEKYSNPIYLLYKGILVDDTGLPYITDKEAKAIATYVAYVQKYKEGLVTNNTTTINMAQLLQRQWGSECDQARIPDHISQNEMNQILDVKASWNRKLFNKSYKPII